MYEVEFFWSNLNNHKNFLAVGMKTYININCLILEIGNNYHQENLLMALNSLSFIHSNFSIIWNNYENCEVNSISVN